MRTREENRLYQRKWRLRNRERLREYQRAWARERRKDNPEKTQANARAYFEKYRGKCNAACRAWYTKNRKQSMQRSRAWQRAHPEKVRAWTRRYHANNPGANAKRSRTWRELHPQSSTKYSRKRRAIDPTFRLITNIRTRINQALKRQVKFDRTIDLLGCSISFYKEYITKLFSPGMSWEARNFEIDHIHEIATFDLTTVEGQRAAFNYWNTRPVSKSDHLERHRRKPSPP